MGLLGRLCKHINRQASTFLLPLWQWIRMAFDVIVTLLLVLIEWFFRSRRVCYC